MTGLEIVLLVCGFICVTVSFIMGNKDEKNESDESKVSVPTELTKQQIEKIRKQVDDVINEQMDGIGEKTEASLDKISNTKILELNEYAETIMGEINRNHNETVFLYDMLNEKAKEVKSTVKDVNLAKRQVERIQAEVTVSDVDAATNETAASDSSTTKDSSAKDSVRDIAKERLAELVKKSNEKARTEDGIKPRNVQAEKLNNIVEQNSLNQSSQSKEVQKDTKKAESEQKELQTKESKSVKKAKTEKDATSKQKSSEQKQAKTKHGSGALHTEEMPQMNIQFEKGANNNQNILKLYSMGLSNKEIAKELNLGVGEVKLVIDLYNSGN